ncbi:MAG: D-alanyl-D-alanine carboxypeptidase/D-alanyl-D-alanine-endopeptidase [Paludibacteraceae bacterium]|nr:D-alanyl-D-alanine carboxypeptidase/D-alanyl-D-alanine-endopeptidase [Paludibacteraceae bacterium]
MLHTFLAILLNITLLTGDSAIASGLLSVEVRNMTRKREVASYQATKAATPASVTKLLTTGAALTELGPDFQFETTLAYSGEIRDSILWGDLIVVGDVDPTLGNLKNGDPFLDDWISQLHEMGIYYIKGRIVADMSKLSDEGYNPHWLPEDIGNYYAPGIYGINYMSNTLRIYLRTGDVGQPAEVLYTDPNNVQIQSRVRAGKTKRDYSYVSGKPLVYVRKMTGEIPANRDTFCVRGDLPNPGLQLAEDLQRALLRAGGRVDGQPSYVMKHATDQDKLKVICVHFSPALRDIIRDTNFDSNNMYAEAIARYLGSLHHKHSTARQAAGHLVRYWRNRKMPMGQCVLHDGCGLAPDNKLTARMVVKLLEHMYRSEYRDDWYASLPVSGESGTLTHFLEDTRLSGRVHAKSGTLTGAKSYAGYIERPNGDLWSFAILISDTQSTSKDIQKAIEKYLLCICK